MLPVLVSEDEVDALETFDTANFVVLYPPNPIYNDLRQFRISKQIDILKKTFMNKQFKYEPYYGYPESNPKNITVKSVDFYYFEDEFTIFITFQVDGSNDIYEDGLTEFVTKITYALVPSIGLVPSEKYIKLSFGARTGGVAADEEVARALRKAAIEHTQDQEEECAICLEKLGDARGTRMRTSCKHRFHKDCLVRWRRGFAERGCPMCRQEILIPDLQTYQPRRKKKGSKSRRRNRNKSKVRKRSKTRL